MNRKLVIFATGKKTGGGTGFENLVKWMPWRVLAVVSSHEHGGVRQKADALFVPFFYFPGPYTVEGYRALIERICTEMKVHERCLWYALSGWFQYVYWLPSARTFNIHSAPLPKFGGAGMYGKKLHRAVWDAYQRGEITESEIVMQFVTNKIDNGPIFFRISVPLHSFKSFEEFEAATHLKEHAFQPAVTQLVMAGKISWDGVHPESLMVPACYPYI